jgi:transposase
MYLQCGNYLLISVVNILRRLARMFPRITKSIRNGHTYQYLVISESVRIKGKGSTTKNIATLGNIDKFGSKDISGLIDGLIKIFKLEKYSLTEGTEMIESLEHGAIVFWQKIWDKLSLSEMIKKLITLQDKRVTLGVAKYIQMMTINRCIDPLSKLAVTRWIETTCYKQMKGYTDLSLEVEYFYRSMDQLLKIKDELELALFKKLETLFSVNVKLTFYDITSSFFYTNNCPIGANGHSRDSRPDKEQIVIGVVTSWEGYPIKHYVFCGNTKDETTVKEVVKKLRAEYCIEETTFVGDRGMITKLNLDRIEEEGFGYIMGVKLRQDEICEMVFSDLNQEDFEEYKDLKIWEKKIRIKEFLVWKAEKILMESGVRGLDEQYKILREQIMALSNDKPPTYKTYKKILQGIAEEIDPKICQKVFRLIKKYYGRYEDELRYVVCLNAERKDIARQRRQEYVSKISTELDKVFSEGKGDQGFIKVEKSINTIFEGYRGKYKKFFEIRRDEANKKASGYRLNQEEIEKEKQLDGIFVLLTSRMDVPKSKVVESYKSLQEVEILFDDLKNFVDIRPIRHWLEERVRAHVFICILALLLKRIFEIHYLGGKSVTEPLEQIYKSKLIKYKVRFSEREGRSKVLVKVTNTTPEQMKYFTMVGIKNPMGLEKFVW